MINDAFSWHIVCVLRRRLLSSPRLLLACCAAVACTLGPAAAQEAPPRPESPPTAGAETTTQQRIPSFAELEAAGALIGEIRIDNQNIFDLDDPKENGVFYRAANALHIRTRAEVIRRQLLFSSGERVSVRLIEETERLLRASRLFYDVSIAPAAYHDGVVDIEVKTYDTWTLRPGVSASREGGVTQRGAKLLDSNAFGTGVLVGVTRISDAVRTGTEYRVTQPRAFDGWTTIDYAYNQNDDGNRRFFSLTRPFYALDTRWAAGFTGSKDNRIDSVFTNGATVARFRHLQDKAEAFGGWSEGLVEGRARRYSIGFTWEEDRHGVEPGVPAPAPLPRDRTVAAPFFRYEVVDDRFEKVKNRDLIERPEYFEMGLKSKLQVGHAWTGFGSTENLSLYSATLSDGSRLSSNQTLLTSAEIEGQYGAGGIAHQRTNGSLRYYRPVDSHSLLFATLTGDVLRAPDTLEQLLLGGEAGLRGYPRNYQSGDRRMLLTVEGRVYSDWYPFRLIRVGGAVFYDLGRAWGGPNENTANAGWLGDVGFGLRILSARSAFGNVAHIDFAFPLHRDPNIKSFQFLVTTKITL